MNQCMYFTCIHMLLFLGAFCATLLVLFIEHCVAVTTNPRWQKVEREREKVAGLR